MSELYFTGVDSYIQIPLVASNEVNIRLEGRDFTFRDAGINRICGIIGVDSDYIGIIPWSNLIVCVIGGVYTQYTYIAPPTNKIEVNLNNGILQIIFDDVEQVSTANTVTFSLNSLMHSGIVDTEAIKGVLSEISVVADGISYISSIAQGVHINTFPISGDKSFSNAFSNAFPVKESTAPVFEETASKFTNMIINQFKTKENFKAIALAINIEVEELKQAVYTYGIGRLLENSKGPQLDIWGNVVGEKRNGRNDTDYLIAIKVKIFILNSFGSLPDISKIVKDLTNATRINVVNSSPAKVIITMYDGFFDETIYNTLKEISAAGVGIILNIGPFKLFGYKKHGTVNTPSKEFIGGYGDSRLTDVQNENNGAGHRTQRIYL